jgi:hypothetical protein
MNRHELYDKLETIGIAVICLNAVMIFIIPALVCRFVQDRKTKGSFEE